MSGPQGFLEAYSPWTSRSTTPKPGVPGPAKGEKDDTKTPKLEQPSGRDHAVNYRHWFSSKDYPKDCPKAAIRWFYATDAPKRKALYSNAPVSEPEALPKPKKYSAFSARDSFAIETAFQKTVEEEARQPSGKSDIGEDPGQRDRTSLADPGAKQDVNIGFGTTESSGAVKVPVNEDFLFDVDIQRRELGPAYWLGPIYDVRRGSWFYQESSTLRPCDENLAGQLEQGYLKIKPWRTSHSTILETSSKSKARPVSMKVGDATEYSELSGGIQETPKNAKEERPPPTKFEMQTQRLFGAYMNSVVTYQDATTAWLLTDDFLSRMSSTMYQRFAGGGHLGGIKVIRGYSETNKTKDTKKDGFAIPEAAKRQPVAEEAGKATATDGETDISSHEEPSILKLERQMSDLDPAKQEEEARRRDEDEIKEDYNEADGDDQGREIEHLLLVTHGIGQKLGLRLEMLNFIRDVNVLRKTLKGVYQSSPDLQLLNSEINKLPKNCRIQVLPIAWRHVLDFPKQTFRQNREQDVADASEEEDYPSLDNITLEPSTIIRGVIRDLGLDILMYQSAYNDHISKIVVKECNRVYDIFMQRNPNFSGKISLIGHSLGSAILFDILCQQKDHVPSMSRSRKASIRKPADDKRSPDIALKFDVEDYYCLGSPLGLYQMLNGRKIAGRWATSHSGKHTSSPVMDDPFLGEASADSAAATDPDIFAISKSTPKCAQLFNIFHPADPIAYRLEPLISTAMSSLKPQPLPYTKKGIFDVQGQGLSAIGNRVGQSVSGLWSSVASNVASSFLNRSLGLTADSQPTSATPQIKPKSAPSSVQIGVNGVQEESDEERPITLIDNELETLYSGFEKSRKIRQSDESHDLGENSQWAEAEQRAKRLRREEAKVRALNSNGRVDFTIQPGVFDMTNPMASIASHLCYWGDEDVSHFMISQLLARQRVVKGKGADL
ncbi:MAG: hypothetical protein Q9217_002907 [Psora testacea]